MIRDAVIHMQGEQPLVADLPTLPMAGDSCLVCTNLRTLDGKRPTFVDEVGSTFIIPLQHVRFIEIQPDGGTARPRPPGPARPVSRPPTRPPPSSTRTSCGASAKPEATGRQEGRCYTRGP